MADIWVISESKTSILELIAHAKKMSRDERVVAWTFSEETAQQAATHGADAVFHLQGEGRPEAWVKTLVDRAKADMPNVILCGSTKRSKEIAARLAAALETGLVSDCFRIEREEGFIAEHYIYGGLCIAREESNSIPFMATMAEKTIDLLPEKSPVNIDVLTGAEESCRVIELRSNSSTSNLSEASVVVCVGRGLANKEDLEMARRLAKALGGEIGCTRPVAEDLHWMPEESYIGISGQTVKPNVYFGLGVSGQIQHISGMRDSKTVIAIDKNENAPIVEAADYAVIGDLYEILPALLTALNA